jgi:hypothetical protein
MGFVVSDHIWCDRRAAQKQGKSARTRRSLSGIQSRDFFVGLRFAGGRLALVAARWSADEAVLPSLSCFFSHDRGIAISLIGYHSPAPCQACQNRRFGAAPRQKHEAMTFIGLSSAPICLVHDVSLHKDFLRPMSWMRIARRRIKLLTQGYSLSATIEIRMSCDPSFSRRLINTRSGVVASGNFNSRTAAVRSCG